MQKEKLLIGVFGQAFGVLGWIKIISFADPKENILSYDSFFIDSGGVWQKLDFSDKRVRGQSITFKLKDVANREQAKTYTNLKIYIDRDSLPKLAQNEYYWDELEGMRVIDEKGDVLGVVSYLIETGSNDVLVLNNDKMIPYIDSVITKVDKGTKTITVDWDLNYL